MSFKLKKVVVFLKNFISVIIIIIIIIIIIVIVIIIYGTASLSPTLNRIL